MNQIHYRNNISMESCAAVIVTYFPSPEHIQNITNISDSCDLVIVVDNTCLYSSFAKCNFKNNIVIVQNTANIGLSAALNIGIKIAGDRGYENIFLFDQDTAIPDSFIVNMSKFKAESELKYRDRIIIVPNFYDRNCKTFAGYFLVGPFRISHVTCKDIKQKFISRSIIAITSGTLLTYSIYNIIGPFRDDYFIDYIDHEYCLRAGIHGIKIIPNCETFMVHSIGKRSIRSQFGITLKPNNHPSIRRYYIARNSIRTAIEYFVYYPFYPLIAVFHIFHEVLSILFCETLKSRKIYALLLGSLHGIFNKMGKYQFLEKN